LLHGSGKDDLVNLPLQKRMYIIPAGCMAFILFFTVFGDKGLLRIYELKQDKNKIDARLADNRNLNEKLKLEIVALKSDRRYIESIARKDFGLVRNNEVIYQFPQGKK
jgi:cell division protein FtsB